MKWNAIVLMIWVAAAWGCQSPEVPESKTPAQTNTEKANAGGESVHGYSLNSIDGQPVALSKYQGKVLLMVNVASNCGFTSQYEGLQKLHEAYSDKGLVVMGIPANEFGSQEPGTDAEIKTFCESRYNVTFPMFSKIKVKGDGLHPLYQHLTAKGGDVTWNFNKFLVGKDGTLIKRYDSPVKPQSEELIAAIETALQAN